VIYTNEQKANFLLSCVTLQTMDYLPGRHILNLIS
jgi:hypothetical protein